LVIGYLERESQEEIKNVREALPFSSTYRECSLNGKREEYPKEREEGVVPERGVSCGILPI